MKNTKDKYCKKHKLYFSDRECPTCWAEETFSKSDFERNYPAYFKKSK